MSTHPVPHELPTLPTIKAVPYGDSALMISLANVTAEERQAGSRRLRDILWEVRPYGLVDIVAGIDSLLVEFDCLQVSHEQLSQTIRLAAAGHSLNGDTPVGAARQFVIPVVVTADYAPDLQDVADELGISTDEVLARLEASELSINLLASAMAPMMGPVQFPGQVSRCREPRTNVDSGSVMVAGTSAIIQPFPGPTGWKVIGRTPLTICDINEDPATSYKPGDQVRFKIVPDSEWERLNGTFLRPVGPNNTMNEDTGVQEGTSHGGR